MGVLQSVGVPRRSDGMLNHDRDLVCVAHQTYTTKIATSLNVWLLEHADTLQTL